VPHFFFHIDDGEYCPDRSGVELSGVKAAQAEALRAAGGILSSEHRVFTSSSPWVMSVTDEEDHLLFALRFSVERPGGLDHL